MNAEIFAEWFKERGERVVRTASSFWHGQPMRSLQAFPYHWVIAPEEDELEELLRTHRASSLRYSTELSKPIGLVSYHAVYEGPSYELTDLRQWARKNVRRGLRSCSIEPVSLARIGEEGFELQNDTLDRQGRRVVWRRDDWVRCWDVAASLPGFEAWGALVEGVLAASVVTFRIDDCCYMLYQQSRRQFLAAHVNNALGFAVTKTMVDRPGIRSILYGLHSLDADPQIDEFKFRLGYHPKPVKQRVVFHPWLRPLANTGTLSAVRNANRGYPSPILSKAEGMLRFYCEGKRAASSQRLPKPLADLGFDPVHGNWPPRTAGELPTDSTGDTPRH